MGDTGSGLYFDYNDMDGRPDCYFMEETPVVATRSGDGIEIREFRDADVYETFWLLMRQDDSSSVAILSCDGHPQLFDNVALVGRFQAEFVSGYIAVPGVVGIELEGDRE